MKHVLLLVVGLVGLIELLVPSWVVRLFTRVAYRNADDAEPREWFHVAARLEGAVLVAVALGGLFRAAREPNRRADTTERSAAES